MLKSRGSANLPDGEIGATLFLTHIAPKTTRHSNDKHTIEV